jgi:hypothetical protein
MIHNILDVESVHLELENLMKIEVISFVTKRA